MAISSAHNGTDQGISATSYTVITGMTVTAPGADEYLACFSVWIATASVQNGRLLQVAIFVNGTIVASTEREIGIDSTLDSSGIYALTSGQISVGAGDDVDVRYKTDDGSNNGTFKLKSIILFPAPSADFSEVANQTDLVEDPGTSYVQMGGSPAMTLTPASGNYLLFFSGSSKSTGFPLINIIHTFDGTDQTVTEIHADQENSIANNAYPYWLVDEVAPNGSQVVEIKYKRTSGGTPSLTTHERTMTLLKVNAADLFEVGSAADDADSTVDEKLLDDMTIIDPGVATYLAVFGSSRFYGNRGTVSTEYSIYEGGVGEADSVRDHFMDASVDSVSHPVMTAMDPTTSLSTDDLQVFWKGSSTDARTNKARNFIALREAIVVAGGATVPQRRQFPMFPHIAM